MQRWRQGRLGCSRGMPETCLYPITLAPWFLSMEPMQEEGDSMTEMYETIDMERSGIRIKQIFAEAGYDVRDIQHILHLSCPQPIYRWFKGQTLPTVNHLFILSRICRVHMEDFLVGKRPKGSCRKKRMSPANSRMLVYFKNVCFCGE